MTITEHFYYNITKVLNVTNFNTPPNVFNYHPPNTLLTAILKIPAKIKTSVITTVPPNTYIYEIKLYFIFNVTTERFLNRGFELKL